MVFAVLLFSLLGVIIRTVGTSIHVTQIALFRSLTGALIAGTLLSVRSNAPPIKNHRALWGRSLIGTGAMVAYFTSVADRSAPLGDIVAIRNTAPLLTVIGAWVFLQERPHARLYVAWALGFVGVLAIAGPGLETTGFVAMLALTAAALSAGRNLFLRVLRDESTERVVLHFSLVSAALMAAVMPFVWRDPTATEWLLMGAAGLCAGIGQLCMTEAYARAPAGPVAITGYIGMVFSYLWSVVIFDESYTAASIAGAVCIAAAGIWMASGKRP